MQRILCLNLSTHSLSATLADVAQAEMRIVSRSERVLDPGQVRDLLPKIDHRRHESNEDQEEQNASDTHQEGREQWLAAEMQELLSQVDGTWDNLIFTVPTPNLLSLHLDLPFSHPRQIERILNLEVQDKVPFSTEEFFLQSTTLSPLSEGIFDIHVTIAPQTYIDTIVRACRLAEIDPPIITTHEHVTIAVFELFPDLQDENTTVVIDSDDCLYAASYIAGAIRSARYITLPSSNGTPLNDLQKKEKALRHLQRSLLSLEQRYNESFQKVVVFSEDDNFVIKAAQILEPEVQHQQLAELDENRDKSFFSALSLLLASPSTESKPLCNFRSGIYAYRPQVKQVLNACRKLAVPFASFFVTLLICGALLYGTRAYRISALEGTLAEQVKQYIPTFSAPPGQEITAIQTQFGTLNKQLKEIDASLRFSPLNTFVQLARIFREDSAMEVKKLRILGNRVIVEGEAPNYDAVDKMKRKLKRKKNGFCRPEDDTSSGPRGNVRFTYEIQLCNG